MLLRLPFWRGSTSYSDLVLAAGLVAVVALMVLPLPLWLIDLLVAVNILIGVGLALLAIYIPTPTAFSSFPSVIMLTTLFRLALSIAITRLILLNADGGEIIETFGELVVGGNFVVGLVIFLIITAVQFIVIAKGAERVAEVSARFTLDGLPGKQMSIDSDLRSGLIDKDMARARRRHLEVETQLYGAMDGAMKFVKGDAIAGIVILLVNLIGGLSIGVLQRELSLSEAAHTYSILTIGDGLVSQIPALLTAIAAGLIITRTSGAEGSAAHLGAAIAGQVAGQRRVGAIAGVVALLLALVPGFPWWIFAPIGALLLANARWGKPPAAPAAPAAPVNSALEPPPELVLYWPVDAAAAPLAELQVAVERIRGEFGVPLSAAQQRPAAHGQWRLELHELVIARGGPAAVEPIDFHELLVRQLPRLIGIQEVSDLLTGWNERYPDLIKEALRIVPPQRLTEILRRLLEERVSIRHLRDIFEALADAGQREKDPALLTELVRQHLARQLTAQCLGEDGVFRPLLVHPEVEQSVREAARNGNVQAHFAAAPEALAALLGAVDSAIAAAPAAPAAIVCSADVRRLLRQLLELRFRQLPVLSFQELVGDVEVMPVGTVRLGPG